MQGRITKSRVEALKAGQALWDDELRGFVARAWASGVSYGVKYRAGHGRGARQRWVIIGRHGAPWTPDTARHRAKAVLLAVGTGQDPARDRDDETVAATVSDLWQLYRQRHSVPSKKPRSVAEDDALARDYILPTFGNSRVVSINRPEVARWHASMFSKPARANRALALLRAMLNKAEVWGMRTEGQNPATRIKKFTERPRERYLSVEELGRLGAALSRFEDEGRCSTPAIGLLRLLLFTGMRLGEGLTLQWGHVDLERGALNLPTSKTGAKTVPLPTPAREVLAAQPRNAASGFVFPGSSEGKPLQGMQKIWQRIRRDAGLDDVRIHDLRHGFASVAVQAGESLYLVGKVLGHRQASTTERYAHAAIDPIRSTSEKTSQTIAAALRDGMTGSNVVMLPMAQRSVQTTKLKRGI